MTTFGPRLILFGFLGLNFGFNSSQAFASPACQQIFAEVTLADLEPKFSDLASLRIKLDDSMANGASSVAISALKSDYDRLEMWLVQVAQEKQLLTRQEIIEKLRSEIIRQQTQVAASKKTNTDEARVRQGKIIADMHVDGTRAIFHRIEPGAFMMGINSDVKVTLTKPFEMMATVTTVKIWYGVLELAKKYNLDPEIPTNMYDPNNPGKYPAVENLNTIWSWMNALNELSKIDVPELGALILNHKQGDQYRLPTEAEWEFVAGDARKMTDKELHKIGWFKENSNKPGIKDVALLAPQIVNGGDFYDFFGNYPQWVADVWSMHPTGGVDPLVTANPKSGKKDFYVVRGFTRFVDAGTVPYGRDSDSIINGKAFRLVREIQEER